MAVTDHDTVAGLAEARAAAVDRGLTFINGIEITAVEEERDVHVLGYFFDPENRLLAEFLTAQREDRVRRVKEMAERLSALGAPIDADPLLQLGLTSGRSVGRPHVAMALVAAGHVRTRDEAFDRYLDRSAPAFVPRRGTPVVQVVRVIRAAGGIASLAHPALSAVDHLIPAFAATGLTALEARHSDHSHATELRYRNLAQAYGLLVSGGSDFHGDDGHHGCELGTVTLSPDDFAKLQAAA